MLRFGVAVWNFEGQGLLAKIPVFAEMGYDAISVLGAFLDPLSPSEEDELARMLDQRDLLLTVHTSFTDREGINEGATLTQAEQVLAFQRRTGRVARLTYDVPWKEVSPGVWEADIEGIAPTFEKVLALTLDSGMRVGLEDCPLDSEHLPEMDSWQARFPHWGMLIDLGHMNMRLHGSKDDPRPLLPGDVESAIRRLPVEVIELHVHGNDGTKDQHAPPYTGSFDFPEAAKALRAVCFEGISTIEIVPAWSGLSPEEALPAAARSLEFWKRLLHQTE